MKIVVAMSGGVDSSVAAAILVRQGHEVVGAFMKNWTDTKDVQGVCDWKNDKRDAERVAAKLGIPLVVMDFQKEYRNGVVDYMFREYRAGRTPNPDVVCNTTVKFGPFLTAAKKLGADKIATGHYARVSLRVPRSGAKQSRQLKGVYHLMRAKDENKDQTYFLHQLSQAQLAHTLFPIGDYTKPQVRALARKFGLPTAERAESMGVCFIGEINMKDFLKQKIKPKPGKIITTSGEIVGEHEGLVYYTIGQRHGFAQRGGGKPLYVVAKDFKKNELLVGPENDLRLFTQEITVEDVHWIAGEVPSVIAMTARFRHRQELQPCEIKNGKSKTIIICAEPQKAITPGQFAVLYRGDECLGGGVIK